MLMSREDMLLVTVAVVALILVALLVQTVWGAIVV
jgi:hypothetical protein